MTDQSRKPAQDPGETLGPNARSIAAKVVARVLCDEAYAAAALDAELRRHPQLDQRERIRQAEHAGKVRSGVLAHAVADHGRGREPPRHPQLGLRVLDRQQGRERQGDPLSVFRRNGPRIFKTLAVLEVRLQPAPGTVALLATGRGILCGRGVRRRHGRHAMESR